MIIVCRDITVPCRFLPITKKWQAKFAVDSETPVLFAVTTFIFWEIYGMEGGITSGAEVQIFSYSLIGS